MRYLLFLFLLGDAGLAAEYRIESDSGYVVEVVEVEKPAASAPTPMAEVVRVIGLLPKPEVGFVDFGCGADARWCIAAAEKWGCKVTGIEINPARVRAARERVRAAGLDHLVTIVEGDAATTEVTADVGAVYLYSDVLAKLKLRLEKLRSFASYMHQPPGLVTVKNGDSWIYTRPVPVVQQKSAIWNGLLYSHPQCNNPNCGMCNSIRSQLAAPVVPAPVQKVAAGHWVKMCNGKQCWMQWVAN